MNTIIDGIMKTIETMYKKTKSRVLMNNEVSKVFKHKVGVQQECLYCYRSHFIAYLSNTSWQKSKFRLFGHVVRTNGTMANIILRVNVGALSGKDQMEGRQDTVWTVGRCNRMDRSL